MKKNRNTAWMLFLCLLLALWASPLLGALGEESIVFQDEAIARAMETWFPELRQRDGSYPVSALTEVDWITIEAPQGSTVSLAELRHLPQLYAVDIYDAGTLTGLEALAECKGLSTLSLFNIGQVDLTPLSQCDGLFDLAFSHCGALNLSPLAESSNLAGLWLSGPNISGIDFLQGNQSLEYLSLDDCAPLDLAVLESCPALNWLALSGESVSNLAPLAGCQGLVALSLEHIDPQADLAPLLGKINLEELTIYGELIRRSEVWQLVAQNQRLSYVNIRLEGERWEGGGSTAQQRMIVSGQAFGAHAELTELCLGGVELTEGETLASLSQLSLLFLDDCRAADWSFLSQLQGIEALHLYDCNLQEVSFVQGMALTSLWLDGNQIRDLSPLEATRFILELSLVGNPVESYQPLAQVQGLEVLLCNEGVTLPDLPNCEIIQGEEG